MSSLRTVLCCLTLYGFLPTTAWAHGSVSNEDDLCAIQIGYYKAHFKIYLPRTRQHRDYCEDLPGTGESVFVMEYLHPGLGEIPVDFRIIRDTTGMGRFAQLEHVQALGDLEPLTVFYQPPTVKPDVFTVMHTFDRPGEFIGIVTAVPHGGGEPYAAVFPFRVGFIGFGYWPLIALLVIVLHLNYLYMSGRFPFKKRARLAPVPAALAGGLLILAGSTVAPTDTAADTWSSAGGLYRLEVRPDASALRINTLHSWILTLSDADGEPVTGAQFEVTGGMPEHNHGLPTEPVVTAEEVTGTYRLEGVRFHMHGYWEVRVRVAADAGRDTILLKLELDPP
ncbi:MAG: FixH family protein [Pseudomonadota bacterium]